MRQVDAEVAVPVDSGDPVAPDTLVAANPATVAGCDRVLDDAVNTGIGIDRVDVLEDRRADRSELRTKRTNGDYFRYNNSSMSFAEEEMHRGGNRGFPSAPPAAMRTRRTIYIYSAAVLAKSSGVKFMRRFTPVSGGCWLIEGRRGQT